MKKSSIAIISLSMLICLGIIMAVIAQSKPAVSDASDIIESASAVNYDEAARIIYTAAESYCVQHSLMPDVTAAPQTIKGTVSAGSNTDTSTLEGTIFQALGPTADGLYYLAVIQNGNISLVYCSDSAESETVSVYPGETKTIAGGIASLGY